MARALRLILALGAVLLADDAAWAQATALEPGCPAAFARVTLEGGVDLCARSIREGADRSYEAEGDVTVTLKENGTRLQADHVRVAGKEAVGEGNVLVAWQRNRIAGVRLVYDLESGDGTIDDATGQFVPESSTGRAEFFFTARRVTKKGEDRVLLETAVISTCTQPTPYWSIAISHADVRLEAYARMRNVRFRAKQLPIVYLPYFLWPVKSDRAAGLLFPDFGSTLNRGNVYRQSLFIPMGDSADLTLTGEYYTRAGFGGGGRFRARPNAAGELDVTGFYIDDQVSGVPRWKYSYQQTQSFLNGFRMVADINQISDFAFYNDYESSINLVSSPTILGRLEFSRNGDWTSVNARELRREQLFSDGTSLVQQTLPEVEWRGRSRRLGRSPLYFTYEASLANIQQRSTRIDADYLRGDLFPTLSAPFSPFPWLDVNPSVKVRMTHWTESQAPPVNSTDPIEVLDTGLSRFVAGGGIELVGPKLFRIIEKPGGRFSKRYKHTIEPRVSYAYQQTFDRSQEILVYDEVDQSIGAVDQIGYGLRSRLFAQRPRSRPALPAGDGERILVPDVSGGPVRETSDTTPPPSESAQALQPATEPPPPQEPVEVASFEISQVRSFERDLSFADLDRNGSNEAFSRRSPVGINGRLNPLPTVSLDVRASYDILYDRMSSLSLSGAYRNDAFRGSFSLVSRPGLAVGVADSTQMRLATGATLWDGRVRFDVEGTYNPDPPAGEKKIPEQVWRLEYYLQCCGFLAEYLRRDFTGAERRDFRFTIDLRGIGKLIDWRGTQQ
jgi:LPS-assembly protein